MLTGIVSTADTSANANATITFNATNIRSITFTYGDNSMFADPTYQHIALDNINYEVVPEPSSLGACTAIVSLAVYFSRRRSSTGPKLSILAPS